MSRNTVGLRAQVVAAITFVAALPGALHAEPPPDLGSVIQQRYDEIVRKQLVQRAEWLERAKEEASEHKDTETATAIDEELRQTLTAIEKTAHTRKPSSDEASFDLEGTIWDFENQRDWQRLRIGSENIELLVPDNQVVTATPFTTVWPGLIQFTINGTKTWIAFDLAHHVAEGFVGRSSFNGQAAQRPEE